MRRLTLILSDLYLPADVVRESFPTALQLPSLDGLLRFADPPRRIESWRSWLARDLGAEAIADWPVAHACAHHLGVEPAGSWLATPVALEARLDHVRLRDRGILHLTLDDLSALAREFQSSFGPETLIAGGTKDVLILGRGPVAPARTTDPARLLDMDVGAALPSGPGSGELRRLSAEIEMWLPGTRVNAGRERARLRKITSLWLWGGGGAPARDRPALTGGDFELYGDDAYLAALVALRATGLLNRAPEGFDHLGAFANAFVVLSPMSGANYQSLAQLESSWFAPIRGALSAGDLDSFRLVANDRVFQISPRAGWKFWRPRRTWLETLA